MPRVVARHNDGSSMSHYDRPSSSGGYRDYGSSDYSSGSRTTSSTYPSGNPDDSHISSACACCCCCIIFVSIIILVFSVSGGIVGPSDRNERIALFLFASLLMHRYNEYVAEWEKSLKSSFLDATFYVNSSKAMLDKVSGDYFPVYDACTVSSEENNCTAAESISYFVPLSLTGQDQVTVNITNANNEVLLSETGITGYFEIYTYKEMNCNPDGESSRDCYSVCIDEGGEYDFYTTNVGLRILSYIFVFVLMDITTLTSQILHSRPFPLPLNHSSSRFSAAGVGCYYSGNYKTFVYARQYKIPDRINVEIRHYADPVISASETTRGCCDKYAYSDSAHACFGNTESEVIMHNILVVGKYLAYAILIITCVFCRS